MPASSKAWTKPWLAWSSEAWSTNWRIPTEYESPVAVSVAASVAASVAPSVATSVGASLPPPHAVSRSAAAAMLAIAVKPFFMKNTFHGSARAARGNESRVTGMLVPEALRAGRHPSLWMVGAVRLRLRTSCSGGGVTGSAPQEMDTGGPAGVAVTTVMSHLARDAVSSQEEIVSGPWSGGKSESVRALAVTLTSRRPSVCVIASRSRSAISAAWTAGASVLKGAVERRFRGFQGSFESQQMRGFRTR